MQCICDCRKDRCDCLSGYGKPAQLDPFVAIILAGAGATVLIGALFLVLKIMGLL